MKQIFIHFPRFQISSIDRSSPKKKEKSFKILFHSNPIDQLQNPLLNYLSTYYLILAKKYYKKIVYTKLYPQFSFTFYLSTTTNNLVKTGWVGYECREKKNFVQEDLCRRKIRRKGGRETKGEYGEELEEEEEEEDGGRKKKERKKGSTTCGHSSASKVESSSSETNELYWQRQIYPRPRYAPA